MTVFGIDPGSERTGYGCVHTDGQREHLVVCGAITAPARASFPQRLHAIARESVERFGGRLPSDETTLLSFKGIGEYTAGAVLSFAFGQRKAILDTTVARVLFRVFVGKGDPKAHRMKRHIVTD